MEDACAVICAEKINADFIITRDADGFKSSRIQALSASDYFTYLVNEHELTYKELFFSISNDDDITLHEPTQKRVNCRVEDWRD